MKPTAEAISEFKGALSKLDDQSMLDRFYYGRPAAMLNPDHDPALRRAVSVHFDIAMRDVLITGSAKLGFTTVAKTERPIFSPFGDRSDIDVAIISGQLFVHFWRRALEYSSEAPDWKGIGSFRRYLSRGWIRPDKLPASPEFKERLAWFEFFQNLTGSGKYGSYKITAGIYFDEKFWEQYACKALSHCRHHIENIL